MFRAGSDIGGTFTDTVLWDEGTGDLFVGKVLTTPADPSSGAINGLKELLQAIDVKPRGLGHIIHGTTLAANAIIERKGARTALLTTKGFRDYLETGREKRYDLYDNLVETPEPLVPRYLRIGITERLDEKGNVVTPLDPQEVRTALRRLRRERVESIAICFLHSFRNPFHERETKRVIEKEITGVHISLSVEVVPEIREFERGSTTVANAYVQPLMAKYVGNLEKKLEMLGCPGRLHIMLSSGGITTPDTCKIFPIRVVESGPAAGAMAAAFYGELTGTNNIMSFDMGGTTAKVCFIEDGKPSSAKEFEVARIHRFKKGSGLPIKLPVIEMIEIGAGGGSIARANKLGLLKVGPESAEANPGPVCYSQGGMEPTVTDADLFLGYLDPEYFLGGRMRLEAEASLKAIRERVAHPLGISATEAAWGIHQIVNENMANAARVHAAEKGKDPRRYTLMAFGGAGPIHALQVAKKLGIRTVMVPLGCGATSALGLLTAPLSFDFVRTFMGRLDQIDLKRVNQLLVEMEEEGRSLLNQAGVRDGGIVVQRLCDMRYIGQGHEIQVPLPMEKLGSHTLGEIQESFNSVYKQLYHRLNEDYPLECLNWRVVTSGHKPSLNLKTFPPAPADSLKKAQKGQRLVFSPEFGQHRPCAVYDRYLLFPGIRFSGPAIIEERESTVVVGPDHEVEVDRYLNLFIASDSVGHHP